MHCWIALCRTVLSFVAWHCSIILAIATAESIFQNLLLFSTLLYCTVLYYTLLYSTLLYSTILYYMFCGFSSKFFPKSAGLKAPASKPGPNVIENEPWQHSEFSSMV